MSTAAPAPAGVSPRRKVSCGWRDDLVRAKAAELGLGPYVIADKLTRLRRARWQSRGSHGIRPDAVDWRSVEHYLGIRERRVPDFDLGSDLVTLLELELDVVADVLVRRSHD